MIITKFRCYFLIAAHLLSIKVKLMHCLICLIAVPDREFISNLFFLCMMDA